MAAATALAAVSCVNKINDYDAERIISFKALRANSTKSSSTNNPSTKTPSNAEEKGAFKVWGYALPQEKNWKDDFKGAKTMLEGENYFHSDGIWKSAEDHLWCSRNERMVSSPSPLPMRMQASHGKKASLSKASTQEILFPTMFHGSNLPLSPTPANPPATLQQG